MKIAWFLDFWGRSWPLRFSPWRRFSDDENCVLIMNSIAGLLFLYLKILLSAGAEKDTRIERRSTLGAIITKKGFCLKGFSFKQARVSSFTSCGQVCLKDPRCISTNFNLLIEDKRYNCELNSAGLQDDDTLVPHRGVVFSQYAYKKVSLHTLKSLITRNNVEKIRIIKTNISVSLRSTRYLSYGRCFH